MKWTKEDDGVKIPIKSWCDELNEKAMQQAVNLANHPVTEKTCCFNAGLPCWLRHADWRSYSL